MKSYKNERISIFKHILIILCFSFLISVVWYFFIPNENELTVKSFSWERKINFEKLQTVEESNDYLPVEARLLSTEEKSSFSPTYRATHPGKIVLSEKKTIIYHYEIDKWVYERSVITSGNDKEPYWGEFDRNTDERVRDVVESYLVTCIDKNYETHEISLSHDDWNSLNIGQTAKFEVSFGKGKIVQ